MSAKDINELDASYSAHDAAEGIRLEAARAALDELRKLEAEDVVAFAFTAILRPSVHPPQGISPPGYQRVQAIHGMVGSLGMIQECIRAMMQEFAEKVDEL